MKIAIGGKGGAGKTTLAALLSISFRDDGYRVIAVDANPDANLASTLGYPSPEGITPLVEMKGLIAERTGAKPGGRGGYFKLNPKVDDIPDRFVALHRGIRILVMGTVRGPAAGCLCPENAFLRELTAHLVLQRSEVLIMDMEAGIEHLGRGTASHMDALFVVVEPSRQSLESAARIVPLARDLGIPRVLGVINKMERKEDLEFVKQGLPGLPIAGAVPFSRTLRSASVGKADIEDAARELKQAIGNLRRALEKDTP
jgi:CO dehydrogenase maturation factor